jgi:hypothetical protein
MFSAKPVDWPGASAARNGAITQLALVEEKALFASITSDLESLVGALINLIPNIGGFLSSLMGIFWPSATDPNVIWQAIKRYIVKAVYLGVESSVMSSVENEFWGILNAIVLDLHNGHAESMNSRIQRLKQRACGYRNRDRFRSAIYFHLGGLDLYPQSRQACAA